MICKDCKPKTFIQMKDGTTQYAGEIILCDRHAELEQNQTVIEAMIANVGEDAQERRRYALLQAAATLLSKYIDVASAEVASKGFTHYVRAEPRRIAVTEAIELLAEIKKREPETHS